MQAYGIDATKVIVVTRKEAHYVLDEIMGNKTDLPITEHATDTHGVTQVIFALLLRDGPATNHVNGRTTQ
ncbi:Tn3 family transposase [Streptomyces sp. Ag109_O5-1]|uniref:Tn3 family transposase n=1 Tax=Streptomyces sp. Ag109_O5-1 TaxID=1938851 RepID=UPI000F4EF216|nr:Tn3 family transposase [Streptomyces sp. Ag109_O5-1]